VRIEWLPEAERTFSTQVAWIAEQNPSAAIAVGDAIEGAVARLDAYPSMGRPGRVPGTRDLAVVGTPYIVVYRIEPAVLLVLRILHGAQRWPPA
jgi:toxin ParE1/3/4